jgi:CRP-like cAMP-binding protein
MKALIDIIQSIYPLSDESMALILPYVRKEIYPKNSYIIRPENLKKEIYFIESGLLRINIRWSDKDYILAFMREKDYIPSNCVSFISEIPIFQSLSLSSVQDSTIYVLNKKILDALFWENLEIALFTLKLINVFLRDAVEGIIRNKCYSPTERYKYILNNCPIIFKNLSINETASFLGINSVSLSRIRKKIIDEQREKKSEIMKSITD